MSGVPLIIPSLRCCLRFFYTSLVVRVAPAVGHNLAVPANHLPEFPLLACGTWDFPATGLGRACCQLPLASSSTMSASKEIKDCTDDFLVDDAQREWLFESMPSAISRAK